MESDIGYAKTSWLRGRVFTSFEDALESLRSWARDVAAVRIHGTTRRRPIDLFEEERSQLRPLPPDPYEIAEFGKYLVRKDWHVQVLRNFYSVPWQLVGKQVRGSPRGGGGVTTEPLDTRLRRLRLCYMAQSVDAHNTASIRQKRSFLEFLALSSMASSAPATTRGS